ncbi:hypothetical protein ACROAH_15070 [Shewanella oncorhynchi]|uniref:hypothetical protein n=1 Tax=Shewanella TaxID=22 RepID=UPI0039AFF650
MSRITIHSVLAELAAELGCISAPNRLVFLEVHLRLIGLDPALISREHLKQLIKLLFDEEINLHPHHSDLALVSIPGSAEPYPVLTARGYNRLYKATNGDFRVKAITKGEAFSTSNMNAMSEPEQYFVAPGTELEGFAAVYCDNNNLLLTGIISVDEVEDVLHRFHRCSLPLVEVGAGLAFNRLFKVNRAFKMSPATSAFAGWFSMARAALKTVYSK